MSKRDGIEPSSVCLSRREVFAELSYVAVAVVERIAMDADLLASDIAKEIYESWHESWLGNAFKPEIYRNLLFSIRNVPKFAAALYTFLVIR